MSFKGLKHWSPRLRKKVHRYIYRNVGVFNMPYDVCKDRRYLAEWLYEMVGHKYIYLFIWRKGYYKKKNRLRPYRIAVINIKSSDNARFVAEYIELRRISRFQWFEPDKKWKPI